MKPFTLLAYTLLCFCLVESRYRRRAARACSRAVDLVFAIDASGSVGDDGFRQEKMFVAHVAQKFHLSRHSTHAAVIVYSSRARVLISLWGGQNFRKFLSSVRRIPYFRGGTRIDLALQIANKRIFTPLRGMRSSVPKIMILMTDGYQTKTRDSMSLDRAVLPLRKKGVHVYALAIGRYTSQKELRLLVQHNSDIFNSNTFSSLQRSVKSIVRTTCDKAVPPASGYYPLNYQSRGRDISIGRGPAATLRNVFVTSGPMSQSGGAYYLKGSSSSYIDIVNRNRGKLDSYNSISIFLWVYTEGRPGPIINYRRNGHGVGIWLNGRRTLTGYIFGRRGVFRRRMYYGYMRPRTWQYIGLTYDKMSGYGRLWINGKVVARSMIGRLYLATQYPLRMGAIYGSKRYFRGKVSCLQVYRESLSTKQVSTIRRRCSARKQVDPCLKLPCQNGGSCIISNKNSLGYRCQCRKGYTGRNCQSHQGRPTVRPTRGTNRPITRPTGPKPRPSPPGRTLPTGIPGTPGTKPFPPGTVTNIQGFRLELLDYINTFRRLHGTSPVILSQKLTTEAQAWAKKTSGLGISKIDPNTKYGVNIYAGADSRAALAQSCVVKWYESVRNFDWSRPRVSVSSMHFSQLVWEESVSVGIGMARGLRGRFYVVVYFDPPGNKAPKVKDNVRPYTDVFILVPQAKCPRGYTLHSGTCYKYHTDMQTWDNAVSGCARENSSLVSIHAPDEDRYISKVPVQGKRGQVWIGLNDRIKEGTYMWSDGSSVEYTNWVANEPSGDDCTVYKFSRFGTMSDRPCSERHSYVCKQPLEGLITYRVKMQITSVVWIEDFSLHTSLAFLQLKKKTEELVMKVYAKDRTLVSAMVEGFRKVAAKRNRVPGSRSSKNRQSSSVTVSLILKFGPRVVPDPTRPLQNHLTQHRGRMAAPLNEKATITSIKIIKPGVSPAFLGTCTRSCASKCLMSCNPMCCTSRIVLNSFNPYRYPSPVGQAAKPFKIIKSPQPYAQQWPYAAPKQAMLKNKVAMRQRAPMPVMLSVSCIPTIQNPCPPGIRSPRRFQATYKPGSSTLTMGPRKALPVASQRLPAAPQVPYVNSVQTPCVPTPSTPCAPYVQNNVQNRMAPLNAGMVPVNTGVASFPMQGFPAQVQRPVYPGMMMPAPVPCVPTPLTSCPPANRKLAKPSTKKPKSRAQMPLPRPVSYTFPFGLQNVQPIANARPAYFNPLLRYQQRPPPQAIRFSQPLGFSLPSQVPQSMQVSYTRPCTPTPFKQCPPKQPGLKAIKVEPAQDAKKDQKPSEISLTQPMQLRGQIFIHPPPGAMFSPIGQGLSPFGPRPPYVKPVAHPKPSKKGQRTKAKNQKKNAKNSPKNPITLSSPLGIMGKVILGSNSPSYAPRGMLNPCVPSLVNPCLPARFPQPVMPYLHPPRFQLPVGTQHPFAGLKPLTPPRPLPGILPYNPLNVQPPRPLNMQPLRPLIMQPPRPLNMQPLRPLNMQPLRPLIMQPPRPLNMQPLRPLIMQPPRPINMQPLRPLNMQPPHPLNMQPSRLAIPRQPQAAAPSRSLVIKLPPIRINYPNNQVPVSAPVTAPIQQPLQPINNRMQQAFPAYCSISCIHAAPNYCPSYCPRVCCKKIIRNKPNLAKKSQHKKVGKRHVKHNITD